MQLVQNAAARVVTNAQMFDRISMSAVRKDLHWLPINARIEFKKLMLKKENCHNSRYSNDYLLDIPQTNLVLYGNRTFREAAPTLSNALPLELRAIKTLNIFKNKLKTHLFSQYYNT